MQLAKLELTISAEGPSPGAQELLSRLIVMVLESGRALLPGATMDFAISLDLPPSQESSGLSVRNSK